MAKRDHEVMDFSGLAIRASEIQNDSGTVVLSGTPSAFVADVAYTAHASGAVAVTSNAATDLDTTAAALEEVVADLAAIKDILIAQGLMAAS